MSTYFSMSKRYAEYNVLMLKDIHACLMMRAHHLASSHHFRETCTRA